MTVYTDITKIFHDVLPDGYRKQLNISVTRKLALHDKVNIEKRLGDTDCRCVRSYKQMLNVGRVTRDLVACGNIINKETHITNKKSLLTLNLVSFFQIQQT